MRHQRLHTACIDMLHETNRRDVITNLLVWIFGILKKNVVILRGQCFDV
jgi:hypothetical protein